MPRQRARTLGFAFAPCVRPAEKRPPLVSIATIFLPRPALSHSKPQPETCMLEMIFWGSAGAIALSYVLYPLVLTAIARLAPRAPRSDARHEPTVSLVIPAYNEE